MRGVECAGDLLEVEVEAAAGLGVLTKAGVPLSPVVIVGVPALLGVISWVMHRRRAIADSVRLASHPPDAAVDAPSG